MAVQIIREGWLRKEGGVRHNWKKRWFTLGTTQMLTYYETADKEIHKGTIDLTKAKLMPSHKKQKYGFAIVCPKRTWYLAAIDNAERQVWLSTLEAMLPRSSMRQSSRSIRDLSADLGIVEDFKEVKEDSIGPRGPGYGSAALLPLPAGWEKMRDKDGKVFYANHVTQTTQWDRPVDAPPRLEYASPPVVAAAPPPSVRVERKSIRKFPLRVVAGQKVRILKRYNKVLARTIGQVVITNTDNSVVVDFGDDREVGFSQSEIAEWLEPWGPIQMGAVGPQPMEIIFYEGRLGLEFKLSGNTFIVTKVVRKYEAHKNGVKEGMQMVSAIDGLGNAIEGSTARQLAVNLSKASRPLSITFVAEEIKQQTNYI